MDARNRRSRRGALRRGLPAAHRLARLGRLPRARGPQPAAPLLPRIDRRNRPADPGGGGLMDTKLESPRPIRGGVHVDQRHNSRPQARHRPRRVHRRHRRAGRHPARLPRPRRQGPRRDRLDRPRRGAGRARRRRRADRRRHPAQRRQPGRQARRSDLRDGKVEFHGQPMFAVVAETRDAARRATKLAKVEYRPLPHVTDVAEAIAADYPFVTEPLKLERGDVAAGDGRGAAPAEGRAARRRPGPFLPRGHDRLRHPRRGRRRHRLFLDPAPVRGAAHGRPRPRRAVERGDDHRPPHGRRLRRQGDPAEPLRRGRRGRRQEARTAP